MLDLPVPSEQASGSSPRERDKRAMPPPPPPPPTRGCRTSVSTIHVADEHENFSFFDESDFERADEPPRRARKSKSTSRHIIPLPGELGLPSRLQPINTFPTTNSAQVPPIVPARSSSLNHKAKSKAHMSVDTHIPSPTLSQITLAVIGPTGCGKTTFIRKGLKMCRLSEPVQDSIPIGLSSLTYLRRSALAPVDTERPEGIMQVLEVDCSPLIGSGTHVWEGLLLDGVIFCYDAANADSFAHVRNRVDEFTRLGLPTIVVACKSDLDIAVDPRDALAVVHPYDTGVIELNAIDASGREKIQTTIEWIVRAIRKKRFPGAVRSDRDGFRNPASPAVLVASTPPPWEMSRASSATPTAASATSSQMAHAQVMQSSVSMPHPYAQTPVPAAQTFRLPTPTSATSSRTPTTPTSPSRARSTSDLLSEHEKSRREEREQHSAGRNAGVASPSVRTRYSLNALSNAGGPVEQTNSQDEPREAAREVVPNQTRAPVWMTLDELLDKLLFLSVSDDDPVFISHFLLTYRRFASPRSVLLAMQKRLRSLDQPSGDPMFACYAQMRICLLLDNWLHWYPTDFAVHGSAGALTALIKFALSKTYLLHYGTVFLPFMDHLNHLRDRDHAWALKVEYESDDSSVLSEEEGYAPLEIEFGSSRKMPQLQPLPTNGGAPSQSHTMATRDRKSSLPLHAKAFAIGNSLLSPLHGGDLADLTPKAKLKRLQSISEDVQKADTKDLAYEITRIECVFFLQIEPRHWLQHVLVQGKKDPETDSIARYNHVSNHIADWVVSLILCHDKAKSRARQMEKFIAVADSLRTAHNYSALRAIVAGINSATFEGDEALQILQSKSPDQLKKFQSYDQLLQSVRSHQKYRMALRNTKGPCIPALEIHLSDLIRAHEGNTDYHDDDPAKIHWAKFNMMAKFIDVVSQCQEWCRNADDNAYLRPPHYKAPEYLLFEKSEILMDLDMQRSRIVPPDSQGAIDGFLPAPSQTSNQQRDAAVLRKILFW